MYWVYQEYKGRLFSLKPFVTEQLAKDYADERFKQSKSRGNQDRFIVQLGNQVVYEVPNSSAETAPEHVTLR